jgi:hypothetical protein
MFRVINVNQTDELINNVFVDFSSLLIKLAFFDELHGLF